MKRNKFSLSNYKLLSCDMGELVPIGLQEVLPGDTFQQSTSALVRVSPLVAPVMHPVHVRIHHWFVPMRLLWSQFENFITGGPDGAYDPEFPVIVSPPSTGFAVGSLADYLGIPTGVADMEVNAMPFRAYAMIWDEWYRDQDLQTDLPYSIDGGLDASTNTTLQNVAWEKDYFTSARPWTQKGPEVTVPLGDTAPVVGIPGRTAKLNINGTPRDVYGGGGNNMGYTGSSGSGTTNATYPTAEPNYWLQADLAGASAANINELRKAFAIQRYQEARARYGSRYTEYLAYLGVKSSDARLQRPEYLGGGKQTIQFSEVLQTGPGPEEESDPVGSLKGHGIGALRSNRYRRFFEEHGYVISMLSVKPKTMYAQGLPRLWNRRTKEDFHQRELEHIGQQEVLNKELYAAHTTPEGTFGYQNRYDEYRRTESTIGGEFRTTLDYWHMARLFATSPTLNADFIKAVPTKRVNAVQTNDVLWIMANHSIQARRSISKMGSSFIL